ncbi:MAG TPA: HWE histidine kinase domain-containing protein [Caulobacteraceae bacterium]|nr:HWE histidine kinase domain-containing protein [Caulobacteraceae bacterium]
MQHAQESGGVLGELSRRLEAVSEELAGVSARLRRHEAAGGDRSPSEAESRYRLILESATDYAIFTMDDERRVTEWNVGAQNVLGWTEEEMLGRSADIIFTPDDRAAGAPEAEQAGAERDGRAADERWHLKKDGSQFWAAGMMTPLRGPSRGYLKILRDRTPERRAEERQRLLLAELQHRVRNVLAVVRSVAARTAETSQSVEDFSSHFEGRLATLARTQNVFSRTGETSVELEELVRDELVSLAAGGSSKVQVKGPPVRLRQGAAETFALALHELATNAVKYGALAHAKGKLTVNWRIFNTSAGQRLSLEWRERGVPLVETDPPRTGFGRDLIERGLPYELGAATSLEFERGGVRAVIELPMTEKTVLMEPDPGAPASN